MKKLLMVLLGVLACSTLVFASGGKETPKGDKPYEIAIVVKLEHPWFDDMKIGIQEAAKELGVNAYMLAPAEADAAQQVALIESCIAKGVDAISVVPNDPAALEPVLKKAQDAGIIVISHEAASAQNVSFDIEAFDNAVMGRRFIDDIVKFGGESGNYAFFVGNLTAETHMERFKAAIAYQKEKYPNWHLLTPTPLVDNENTQTAYEKTLELIATYGDKLNAIVTCAAASPVGVAQALREKNMVGKVVSVGSSVPSMVKPYIEDGSVSAISLWRPADAGYVQVWLAKELLDGKTITEGQSIPKFGPITIKGKVILGGDSGCVDWDKSVMNDWYF
ncbi:substrate-binding domain-containing protein [uncultured Sphaerochaeta sp.]|uniref:substrate-binding domain-containing protein n=1 Tax=uncultured Sphaerochaeta sp. TaxID=886478 RepID=UPI002A0A8CE4|nr:substrate-binding domain-containing protein [uncultured Sphaerochaeta sp.]